MNDKGHYIRERLPDQKHTIDLLTAEDPEFLALCQDFDACVDALRYWVTSNEPDAKTRVIEYRILIEELEEEIKVALVAVKPSKLH